MQAIQVKYLSPSNVRGARLKARADAGSKTIDYPHELGQGEPAFRFAAEALAQKLGWDNPVYGRLAGGQLPDGSWAFVFASTSKNPPVVAQRRATRRNVPTVPFKSLGVGARFEFDREGMPLSSGAMRGPWIKTSGRSYTHATSGGAYRVGTIFVKVVPV